MRFDTPLTQRFGGTVDYRAISIACRRRHVPYQGEWRAAFAVDGPLSRRADKSAPRRLSCFSMESHAMSDKLLINLFGLTISADGIYAIVAAVIIIVFVLARRQPR
jgi:hypothetical protein